MFEQMYISVAANFFVAAYVLYYYTCADLNEGKFPIGKVHVWGGGGGGGGGRSDSFGSDL